MARRGIRPGLTGTDVFRPTRAFAWYLFVGADGQAVAYDVTLNGNLWQDSRSVTVTPSVAEIQAGFALLFDGVRLTYTQVLQTQESATRRAACTSWGRWRCRCGSEAKQGQGSALTRRAEGPSRDAGQVFNEARR